MKCIGSQIFESFHRVLHLFPKTNNPKPTLCLLYRKPKIFSFSLGSLRINFSHLLPISFLFSSLMLLARAERFCWKNLYMSINFTWSDMFAKLMFVEFFPPVDKFLVLHASSLRPFFKKKIKTKKTVCYYSKLVFIFFNLLVAKAMRVPHNLTSYV